MSQNQVFQLVRVSEPKLLTSGKSSLIFKILKKEEKEVLISANETVKIPIYKEVEGAKIEVWEQYSGFFIGNYTTNRNGIFEIKIEKIFSWVLQMKITGDSYSEYINNVKGVSFLSSLLNYYPLNYNYKDVVSAVGLTATDTIFQEADLTYRPVVKLVWNSGLSINNP